MRLHKVLVDKKQYVLIKEYESKYGDNIRSLDFMIPMKIQGAWGLYKVHYCYASFYNRYYAELELKEKADGKFEALLLAIKNASKGG
ncbi:hypothetical protein [Lysinibacillus sphaericus]|nr:hypothetical protein [Lysinibacillus sphaericus]AMO35465.1 hypothetical protein AR327_23525 [Lysinibacillus sphaericus]